MDTFVFKILKKLNEGGVGNEVDITDLILEEYPNVNVMEQSSVTQAAVRIFVIINELLKKEHIAPFARPSIGSGNSTGGYRWFDKDRLKLRLTNTGLERLTEELNKGDEERLKDSLIEANESVRKTNDATISNYEFQKKVAKWSMALAALSTAFILISIIQTALNESQPELKALQLELKNLSSTLQNIRISLEKKDSTRIVIIHDTVYVKK